MPLINFQTDLTNLPWGRDKRDGGNSKQPYITKDIPQGLDSDNLPVRTGPDFIVRGGLKSISRTEDDILRLGQMFLDTENISAGIGFIAKQNILSRTAVKTQASTGLGYGGILKQKYKGGGGLFGNQEGLRLKGGGLVNQGVYTPISTLAAAAGNATGTHPNLLGIDPFSPMAGIVQGSFLGGFLGLRGYDKVASPSLEVIGGEITQINDTPNRLETFYNRMEEVGTSNDVNIISYGGGPGAPLGIGRTYIPFADKRTGAANQFGAEILQGIYQVGTAHSGRDEEAIANKETFTLTKGAVRQYEAIFGESIEDINNVQVTNNGSYRSEADYVTSLSLPISGSGGIITNPRKLYENGSRVWDANQFASQSSYHQTLLFPEDFRRNVYTVGGDALAPTEGSGFYNNPTGSDDPFLRGSQKSKTLSVSPGYRTNNSDYRNYGGEPGKTAGVIRGDETTYGQKNVWNYGIPAEQLEAIDKINSMPMYSNEGVADGSKTINDLVKFRIAAIDNNNNGSAVYMHFRAFLDSFDDAYTSTWNNVQYVGRGDSLYNYQGFNRSINLSFKVAAQSKAELIPMYKKLNYLASTLAPSYSPGGFMRGNLVRLTVGGYLYEQPGFITSLTYTVPQESPWEIALAPNGNADNSVEEMPHVIEVSGFQFTPIHTFLPSKPEGASPEESAMLANNPLTGSNAGNQRFIALTKTTDKTNQTLNGYYKEYPFYPKNPGPGGGDNQQETQN